MEAPDRALRLMGLAARGGHLVPGTERVREAVRTGAVYHVVVADDASAETKDKLIPLLEARGVSHTVVFRRAELGLAAGRSPISAVALTDRGLAEGIQELLGGRDAALPPQRRHGDDGGRRGGRTRRKER